MFAKHLLCAVVVSLGVTAAAQAQVQTAPPTLSPPTLQTAPSTVPAAPATTYAPVAPAAQAAPAVPSAPVTQAAPYPSAPAPVPAARVMPSAAAPVPSPVTPSPYRTAPRQAALDPTGPIRNVVLVHGAFTDGSSWNAVIARLQKKGYHVSAVQNPLTSLADDVAATRRVLSHQVGPTILVGHSWGGTVITEAGANAPNVVGLVYVAALAPDRGETSEDLMKKGPSMPAADSIIQDQNNYLWFDPMTYRPFFAADVPDNLTRVLAATQTPINSNAFDEKITRVAWREKPSWYIITTRDQTVSPDLQQSLAERMNANIVRVPSSHLAPVSHPGEIADTIEAAARELERQQ